MSGNYLDVIVFVLILAVVFVWAYGAPPESEANR